MEEHLPRRLAAIRYADVAGYSRLTREDEDATHRTLSEYLDLVASTIEFHRGRVMHYAGDAVLAKFDAVVDAMSAAVAIQNELKTRNENLPDERKVQFRIGVNSGDVIEDRGDIYGDGVNVAARLESLADPGGICISESVRTAVGKKLDIGYKFMGEQKVKNISEPLRTYKVQMELEKGVGPLAGPGPLESPEKPSVAVLPFNDLSRDSSQNHLTVGLAEELVATLGCIPWFFVSAPTVSLSSEIAQKPETQIGNILGVRYLVGGSVQLSKDKLRIMVHLTNAENGQQIWAEKFDGNQDDLFDLQDHIARTVIGVIEPKMLQVETLRSQAKHGSLTAFDYYLRALTHIRMMDQENLKQASDLLRLAIQANQQYAAAHGLIAWLMTLQVPQGLGFNAKTGLVHAQKAIEYSQGDADALSTGGYSLGFINYDPQAGLVYLHESLSVNPNSARAHDFAGWLQCYSGDADAALEHFDSSINLSRIDVFTFRSLAGKACSMFFLGRFEEAVEFAKRSLVANPNFTPCHRVLASALVRCNRNDEARAVIEDLLRQVRGLTVARYAKETRFCYPVYKKMLLEGLSEAGLPEG